MDAVGLYPQGDAVGLDLFRCGKIYIGEVGLLLEGLLLEPLGVHIIGQLDLPTCYHGHLMTGPGKVQTDIPSGVRTADYNDPVPQFRLMTEYGFRQPGVFGAGNRRVDRFGAGRTENGIIALFFQQFRRGCYAEL